MPMINPKTGKPYPNTPAGKAASKAEYERRAKAAKFDKKGGFKSGKLKRKMPTTKNPPKRPVRNKPKSRGY
ncbi:MAG: hypothetical protein CMJ25_21355 [Phycisphaerae bacterium]|nr:hypothetical protein [Phycisphaerae bacterium]